MKILIIQLARLGDIYLTWPTIRAIRRINPNIEIHLLTRKKFQPASIGLKEINKSITLDTANILAPLINIEPQIDESLELMSNLINSLKEEKYDKIINLSFSPISSYITHFISHRHSEIKGYTRHEDGFFNIPDDASAYFYAQVGINKPNRIHLADLFAHIADTELMLEDWQQDIKWENPLLAEQLKPSSYILFHIGASNEEKSLPASKWQSVIKNISNKIWRKIILIGSKEEKIKADNIISILNKTKIINLVGKTQLPELFPIIKNASLLIGCDSAPIHIASLTNTPTLNISFNNVKFWETGPRSANAKIIWEENAEKLPSDKIANEIIHILENRNPLFSNFKTIDSIPSYTPIHPFTHNVHSNFTWKLVEALYMEKDFPSPYDELFIKGIEKLYETNLLIIEQLENLNKAEDAINKNNEIIQNIILRSEDTLNAIQAWVPTIKPIINWIQTEKIRISPDNIKEVIQKNLLINYNLEKVLDYYLINFNKIPLEYNSDQKYLEQK